MAWLGPRRPAPAPQPPAEDDSPAALRLKLSQLIWFVNRNSGQLPAEAVVGARQVLDDLRATIDSGDRSHLDVYLVITLKATLEDYLPTTLRAYLAIDEAQRDVVRPPAGTPTQALIAQINDLQIAAEALLAASRQSDPDALIIQGKFLQNRFAGSDLDLP